MKVKIFNASHYESSIKKMEEEINSFLAEGDGEIIDSSFHVEGDLLYYFVEYED